MAEAPRTHIRDRGRVLEPLTSVLVIALVLVLHILVLVLLLILEALKMFCQVMLVSRPSVVKGVRQKDQDN